MGHHAGRDQGQGARGHGRAGRERQRRRKRPPGAGAAEDIAGLTESAYWPPFLVDQRSWGLSVQAYALRSARNWGIGDFEDMARLAEFAAKRGADFIGVSRCMRCSSPTLRASVRTVLLRATSSIRS
ncbi:hypothetical protein AUC71_14135 [Methyloceanibacter marginalis]|uniref:4-alpha-glucanotransferase n=1 Tax=Methyloceanibacter marginalis TaxID=1774971 RepID=A0A1E3WA14_9HYPH|nr:hypothetical protein AUC71_14135 [Methyloceanibacter marginalis]